ncbi:efflux RND transporter permease subunit [Marinibactrum halimedae]|uniref:Multidrug transporter AcrB n=1 Tax=Marinibactrum halimedae TaxID=1444977 RepID=A0AA37WKN5_9GAMM|nr:efflux RND transporter permease subunit [Marinibactrum halimedae]MCD9459152.1 efflux RND transporter permease subunit [Marinibactrum halimedae]GLS24754.1 multidrug transporter AcrB [Marinibactrum halimedae]
MTLTTVFFNYRRLVFMVLAIVLLYGVSSYFTLPAQEDPKILIREALVITRYPGLNPERVEELITRKLEREIRKIPEIERITSSSTIGQSIIHVEIQDRFTNLNAIWQNLRNKVNSAQSLLPEGTGRSVVNDEFGEVAVVTLALSAEGFEMAAMNDMAKHIRDTLYTVPGTNKIDVFGVQDERIFLEISNAKLAQLGVSPNQLLNILQNQNIIRPGGAVDTGQQSFVIEPTGNFESVDDIANTLVSLPGTDDVVPISDIVNIRRDYIDPPNESSYFNGKESIIFAISMLSGNNLLEYAPRVKAKIEELQDTIPVGFNLDIATYQADQVAKTVFGVSTNVGQTLVIVLVVVILFLGMRTGLIVGTIVPCVMLATLAIMNISGMALERMSLATLIIALGLLVDNGIVIAEEFKRLLEMGRSREEAMEACGRELTVPLLVSSLTTILVFLPLMLAEHAAGEYTRSISLVILISLMTSWVLALGVTPTLCYYFLKIDPKKIAKNSDDSNDGKLTVMDRIYNGYRVFLHRILYHRILFLMSMLGLFLATGVLMGFVPQQFFPDSDRSQILVYTELPSNTSARTTDREMRKAFSWLGDKQVFPHIESVSGYVGYGGPRFVLSLSPEDPAENKGFMVVNIDELENVDTTIDKLRTGFSEQFPEMFVRVTRMFLGPSDSSKLEVQVKGPDADVIYHKAQEIAALLRDVPGTIDVRTNWENRITNVIVDVDQQRARRAGVTSSDIANSMQGYFDGTMVTEFRDGGDIIPIIMRAEETERMNLDRMRSMNVYSSAENTNVPLFQIADFKPQNRYARIEREDMFRTVTVEAKSLLYTAEDLKALVDADIQAAGEDLPLNHHIEYDGVIAESADAQKALSASVPMILGIIVVLLVWQFNSYRKPGIIIVTIPLALIGAVLGLLVTNSAFGFMVTLGLYSLAGIIINNAIVLIERIELEMEAGLEPYDAIVNACLIRLRPITMTTITTVLGLLPLILANDPLFYGMSNAMAFGLGIGTLLTLGVVPVLYAIFYKIPAPHRSV